jgi:hypothetical protein
MKNKTKICCLDVDESIIKFLSRDFDVYNGSLGKKIEIGNCGYGNDPKHLLLNYNLPNNLHEYNVLIDEMHKPIIIPYEIPNNDQYIVNREAYYFVSYYPDTIFDPIPWGCIYVNECLQNKKDKPILKILFHTNEYDIKYLLENIANHRDVTEKTYSNHCHTINFADTNMNGENVVLCDNKLSKILFQAFLDKISYLQTYRNPTRRNDNVGILVGEIKSLDNS